MPEQESDQYAYRVTFEYEGNEIRKLAQQRVEMISPPSHPLATENGVGFWYELRDAQDNAVYRRIMQSPIQNSVEVFSPDGQITRRPVAEPRGVFQVIVPDLPRAATLVIVGTAQPPTELMGSHAEERARASRPRVGILPATEIARFDLRGDTK